MLAARHLIPVLDAVGFDEPSHTYTALGKRVPIYSERLSAPFGGAMTALAAYPKRNTASYVGALFKVFMPYVTYDTVFDNTRAVEELGEAPELQGFETRLREDCELEVEKGADSDMNDLFVQLKEQGIEVASLRNKANRLEEMFMHLVESKGDAA